MKSIEWLKENLNKRNLATEFDEAELLQIGRNCIRGYDLDCVSRTDWEKKTEDGLKIARQITEIKTYPWPKAAKDAQDYITETIERGK